MEDRFPFFGHNRTKNLIIEIIRSGDYYYYYLVCSAIDIFNNQIRSLKEIFPSSTFHFSYGFNYLANVISISVDSDTDIQGIHKRMVRFKK
jgi:hypothetical protein